MKNLKLNTALGRIYWGTEFDEWPVTNPWLRLEVDQRYFEARPRGWYVGRLEDGSVYLRSPLGQGSRTEALIVDYDQRYLNRVELTLLEIPVVSTIYWVGENLVSITLRSDPISNPAAFLRSFGRKVSRSLLNVPHQVAEPLEDPLHGMPRYYGKLWVFGSGAYYCQPDEGLVGPDGYKIWISCRNGSTEKGTWFYGGISEILVCDTTDLVEYRVTEGEVLSAKLVVFAGDLSTGLSAEWEPVKDEKAARRIHHIWKVVKERAQGDTHYWYDERTRRTYGYSKEVLQVLADAEDFLAKHLPS